MWRSRRRKRRRRRGERKKGEKGRGVRMGNNLTKCRLFFDDLVQLHTCLQTPYAPTHKVLADGPRRLWSPAPGKTADTPRKGWTDQLYLRDSRSAAQHWLHPQLTDLCKRVVCSARRKPTYRCAAGWQGR